MREALDGVELERCVVTLARRWPETDRRVGLVSRIHPPCNFSKYSTLFGWWALVGRGRVLRRKLIAVLC